MAYHPGNVARLTASFTDMTGQAVDPTTVTFIVRKPDGTTDTPAPTKDAVGVYHVDETIDSAGEWLWRATGTGAAAASADSSFTVEPNTF